MEGLFHKQEETVGGGVKKSGASLSLLTDVKNRTKACHFGAYGVRAVLQQQRVEISLTMGSSFIMLRYVQFW